MYISILGRKLDGSYVTIIRDDLKKGNVLLRDCRFSEFDSLGFIEKIVFGGKSEVNFNCVDNCMAKTLLIAFERYSLPLTVVSSKVVEVFENGSLLKIRVCLEYYDGDKEVLEVSYVR